jgi:phosphoglycerol transferase MdoB-like AlkP superfamily enzyme
MGFDRFYSLKDFTGLPGKGMYAADGPFLKRTLEYIGEMDEPYFAYVITMSSHGDFLTLNYVSNDMIDMEIKVPGDRQTENYFRVINYVDRSLEGFYEGLVSQNKPFILVICGDHTSGIRSREYQSRTDHAERVPMFIVRKGEGSRGEILTPASQIDIPPTILSLIGIPSPSDWQGIDLVTQSRERLYLKNRRISVDAAGEVKKLASDDREWEETVFAVEKYIR